MTHERRRAVTAAVLLGMALAALEVTIVGTAMPTIIADLGGLNHFSWVVSAYLITSTVPVPVWGKLSDIYGRRRLYQIGIGIFLLGSILSGMAQGMMQLIICRALQGLGAGVLIPLAMTIIGDIYTLEERTRMQAVFSGVWGLSSIVGPFIGGLITDYYSWRWVFYINVPFGLAAAAIINFALQEPIRTTRPKIDYAGAGTLIVAVTLLMLALVEDEGHGGLLSPRNISLVTVSLILLGIFIGIERRAADPILPLNLFRNRVVSVAVIAGFCAGVGMFGAISFVPFFAQGVLGVSATSAGSLLTPLLLSWVLMGILGGRMLLKVGFRAVAAAGFIFMILGLGGLATSGRETLRPVLMAELSLLGCGLGLVVLTLLLASQQSVARTQLGVVTSLTQFSRTIGGAVGVAVMGVVLSLGLSSELMKAARPGTDLTPELARSLAARPNALMDAAARAKLPPAVAATLQQALAVALDNAFILCAALAVVGLITVFFLPSRIAQPKPESVTPEACEKLLIEEMTATAPEHETSAALKEG